MNNENICPETGKPHILDWNDLGITSDGGELYLDISCKNCGKSGCVGRIKYLENKITW
jgi:hypothetical protein